VVYSQQKGPGDIMRLEINGEVYEAKAEQIEPRHMSRPKGGTDPLPADCGVTICDEDGEDTPGNTEYESILDQFLDQTPEQLAGLMVRTLVSW
jgi:hypothetical protein